MTADSVIGASTVGTCGLNLGHLSGLPTAPCLEALWADVLDWHPRWQTYWGVRQTPNTPPVLRAYSAEAAKAGSTAEGGCDGGASCTDEGPWYAQWMLDDWFDAAESDLGFNDPYLSRSLLRHAASEQGSVRRSRSQPGGVIAVGIGLTGLLSATRRRKQI